MPEDAFDALRAQLGGPPPEGLKQLKPEDLRDLSAAVRTARRRQAQALTQAGERALAHIPRLLRGPVKRIVG
jgi:hypothetical protein